MSAYADVASVSEGALIPVSWTSQKQSVNFRKRFGRIGYVWMASLICWDGGFFVLIYSMACFYQSACASERVYALTGVLSG